MTNPQRVRVDGNSPAAQAERERIVQETFVQEGTFVAFPLCFPGATTPIPIDESRILALDFAENGLICGLSGGEAIHLFSGQLRAATGAVVDHGILSGATGVAGVCAMKSNVIAGIQTSEGGRLVSRKLQWIKADLLQEWSFPIETIVISDPILPGSNLRSIVRNSSRSWILGCADDQLFTISEGSLEPQWLGQIALAGPLVACGDSIFGFDGESSLWRFDGQSRKIKNQAIHLPPNLGVPQVWAVDKNRGLIYAAGSGAALFCINPESAEAVEVAEAPLPRVTSMAITHDGRLFGTCGEGVQQLFTLDPVDWEVRALGAAVSVMERRRYGYEFSCAATARDGEIYFGENDNAGHLWVYFPRILPQ